MKQNRLIKLLAAGAVSAVALSTAVAQTTTHETTTTTGAGTGAGVTTSTTGGTTGVSATTTTGGTTGVSATTSTSTLDGTGTISAYTPGQDYIMLGAGSGSPSRYYYTKSTTVVDPTGATVDWSMLRPDLPVKYTYVKEGDRMVISKITVQKPVSEIRETTTTTTTTKKK